MNLESVSQQTHPLLGRKNTADPDQATPAVWIHDSGLKHVTGKLLGFTLMAECVLLLTAVLTASPDWLRIAAAVIFLPTIYLLWELRGQVLIKRSALRQSDRVKELLDERVRKRTAELTMACEALKDEALERQWSAQAMEHQMRYSQLIINAFGDAVFVVTRTLKITRLNPVTLHLTGYTESELVGNPLTKALRIAFKGQDEIIRKTDPLEVALKENRDIPERSAFLLGKMGKILPATVRVFPLRDHDKVVGAVVVTRLVTKAAGPDDK